MTRVFGHGGLRLVLLSLLEDEPKHGYELIVALEERFMGMYRPSSGTVYPRLAALEDEGLVTSVEEDGRRTYALTDAGRAELARRRADLDETVTSAASAVRAAMEGIQAEIRAAVAGVQAEVSQAVAGTRRGARADDGAGSAADAARKVGEQARRAGEQARHVAVDEARRVRQAADELRRQAAYEARRARVGTEPFPATRPPAAPAQLAGPGAATAATAATEAVKAAAASAAEAAGAVRTELEDLLADLSGWVGEAGDLVRRHMPDDRQRARLRAALDEARRVFLETLGTDGGAGQPPSPPSPSGTA